MTKKVIRKSSILVVLYSVVFMFCSPIYVEVNKTNTGENQTKEATTIIKTKSDPHDIVVLDKPKEEKQIVKKPTKPTKPTNKIINPNKTPSRGGSIDYDTTFELTFYSGLVCENSKYGAVNHKGVKLFDGVVANNVLPYKTKIKLDGWGMVEVLDVGGNNFDSSKRLDVYVPRNQGESDSEYYNRVQKMGCVKVKGKIIN